MDDFLFRGDVADVDPDVAQLIEYETERQARKLILIPSESSAPLARGFRWLRSLTLGSHDGAKT